MIQIYNDNCNIIAHKKHIKSTQKAEITVTFKSNI